MAAPDQGWIRAANIANFYIQCYADSLPRPLLEKPSPDAVSDAQTALSSFGSQDFIAALGLTSGSLAYVSSFDNSKLCDITERRYVFDGQIPREQGVRAITHLYSVKAIPPEDSGRSPQHFPTDILVVLYNRSNDPLGAQMIQGKEGFYAIRPQLSGILYNRTGGDFVIKVKDKGMPIDNLDVIVDKLIRTISAAPIVC